MRPASFRRTGSSTSASGDSVPQEAAVGQPQQSFDGNDLYPTLVAKVSALGYSLIQNHPFVDSNRRIGHAAMEAMLMLNGF